MRRQPVQRKASLPTARCRCQHPDTSVEVLTWQPGRLVSGAPSQGTGKNAMGFARRVTSVAKMPPKIIVMTTAPAIEDLIQGDVQIQLTPRTASTWI